MILLIALFSGLVSTILKFYFFNWHFLIEKLYYKKTVIVKYGEFQLEKDTQVSERQNLQKSTYEHSQEVSYLQSTSKKHLVGPLHPDFERVPDGQIAIAIGLELVRFKHPLADKPLHIKLVVVMKPEQ
jgi:hypothetical protein